MNISELKDQMQRRALEWDGLYTKAGKRVEVGEQVRAWFRVVDSMTKKLVNPRKDEEAMFREIITYGDKILANLKKNRSKPPTREEDIRRNY